MMSLSLLWLDSGDLQTTDVPGKCLPVCICKVQYMSVRPVTVIKTLLKLNKISDNSNQRTNILFNKMHQF